MFEFELEKQSKGSLRKNLDQPWPVGWERAINISLEITRIYSTCSGPRIYYLASVPSCFELPLGPWCCCMYKCVLR